MEDLENLKSIAEGAVKAEEHARDLLASAVEQRKDACVAYNHALAKDRGLVDKKTIVVVPAQYSWDRAAGKVERLVCVAPSDATIGEYIGWMVTARCRLHRARRRAIRFNIAEAETTGEILVT